MQHWIYTIRLARTESKKNTLRHCDTDTLTGYGTYCAFIIFVGHGYQYTVLYVLYNEFGLPRSKLQSFRFFLTSMFRIQTFFGGRGVFLCFSFFHVQYLYKPDKSVDPQN